MSQLEPREGVGDELVGVHQVRKVYTPSPWWLRTMLQSAVRQPVVALAGLSFKLRAGEICAVVGPNGAGKSTLFRILTGLTTPTSGYAEVGGEDSMSQSAEVRRIVGFVPSDDRSLWLRHTARDNLEFHASLLGVSRNRVSKRVDEALELVGLAGAGDRVGFALSAGMRARLQLARALLHRPRVLVLDEPTGAIDPVGAFHLLASIERLTKEQHLAVLISSHRLEEIEALHDQVLLLDRGELVFHGPLSQLRSMWETPRLVIAFGSPESAAAAGAKLSRHPDLAVESIDDRGVTIATTVPLGSVLSQLPEQVADIDSIDQSRMALRELLARVAAGARPMSEDEGP